MRGRHLRKGPVPSRSGFEALLRPPARKMSAERTLLTMLHVIQRRRQRRKPERLLYRDGITRDELVRLVSEVGREQVEGVLKALDLSVGEPALTPAE